MKKKLLIICVALFAIKGYTQDSIVNYFDGKGKKTIREFAEIIEITLKKSDSIWEFSRYRENGIIGHRSFSKTKEKKKKIGQEMAYSRKGKMIALRFYDLNGLKDGRVKCWFYEGNKSHLGRYVKDKKESVWTYFHHNGNIASKLYYKNDTLLKRVIYNERGDLTKDKVIETQMAFFKGGNNAFRARIQKVMMQVSHKIKKRVVLRFTINFNGDIKDVYFNQPLRADIEKEIIEKTKKIKGWSPAIHMNRRVSTYRKVLLNFREKKHDK